MAAKKTESESSPVKRRQSLNADIEKFLAAGNKIEYIPDGVSAQDPQGRGKPLSSNTSQKPAAATTTAADPAKEVAGTTTTEATTTEATTAEATTAEATTAETQDSEGSDSKEVAGDKA